MLDHASKPLDCVAMLLMENPYHPSVTMLEHLRNAGAADQSRDASHGEALPAQPQHQGGESHEGHGSRGYQNRSGGVRLSLLK